MAVGSIFVELDLDYTKFERNQQKLIQSATASSLSIEKNFQNLGVKSDKIYDAMRISATNSLEMIKAKSTSTGNEIARAQAAHTATMKRLNDEQFGHQVSLLDKMKQNWLGLTAAVTAAYLTASKAWDLASARAEFEQSRQAFKSMADSMGADAEEVFSKVKRLSSGLIDDAALTKSMNTALSLGIPIEKLGDLMTVARAKSRDMGITTTQAFDDIARGIGRGSPLILDNLGLMLKLGSANEAMAAAVGKTVEQLTDQEKKTAILNATLEAGKEAVARYNLEILTMKERMDALKVQIVDIKLVIGDFLLRSGAGLLALFQTGAELATTFASALLAPVLAIAKLTDYLGITKALGADVIVVMDAMAASAEDLGKKAADNFSLMAKGMASVGAGGPPLIRGAGGGTGAAAGVAGVDKEALRLRDLDLKGWVDYAEAIVRENEELAKRLFEITKKRFDDEQKELDEYQKNELEGWVAHAQRIVEENEAAAKATSDAWKKIHDPDAMVDFYDSIVGYEKEAYDRKVALINAERDARIAAGVDAVAANKKAQQDIQKLDQETFEKKARQVHMALGDMAYAFDSISSMYDQNSDEYAKMQEAAKAMIVLQQAVAVANAVAAIANQGLGDPYTAFARIAAMAAAMGSLLASIGQSVGGGGASTPSLPASTVLGAEAGTGSESIAKVWELLEDTYDLEYRELTGIHESMKDLNRNITGLVTSIVRTGSIEGAAKGFVPSKTLTMFGTYGEKGEDSISKLGNWFLNTVVGGIFGGGKKQTLEETGIEFMAQSAGDLIAGEYMDAMNYAVIKTVKDGGWFRKDKTSYSTIYESLDEDVSRLFTLVFQDMSATLMDLAKGLGTDVSAVLAYEFEGARLDLKGKTGDEVQKTLSEFFSGVGDTAVRELFGNLVAQYQQLNEGLFETAARLVIDKEIVNEILRMTQQGFPGTTAQIIAFSEALIEMAGGLDVLQDAADVYFDKFFTDAEHTARTYEMLTGYFADMNELFPDTRAGFRAMLEGLDLTNKADQEQYVMMLKLAGAADEYYEAMGDVLDQQEDLTKALRDQSEMIRDWISDLSRSALAPVQSMEGWRLEYDRQKAIASAPGATTQDVSGYLNYAKEYLSFMKSYGGDYMATYQSVVGDVQQLGEMKDAALQQLDAIVAADAAARSNADRIVAAITTGRDIGGPNPPLRQYAAGGLTSGPSLAGEAGREWVVPTYEPQRSRFLESAPPQFWENLRGAGVVQQGGGDITVHVPVYLNEKVVADVVAKQIPRNTNLNDAIASVRKVN